MAPKRRRSGEEERPVIGKPNSNGALSRVTRSSTRRLNDGLLADSVAQSELPQLKKAKANSSRGVKGGKAGKQRKIASADNLESEEEAPPPPVKVVVDGSMTKTIVIEHCKQCNSFKARAIQVKNGLENGISGIIVLVNPEKPRRGCFEIREEGGETLISLLDMKRPFKPMKELDMDKVISDIVDKLS
ncbi:hypothetical protein U1Q18_003008 [Sarracenia purpurea var. burkii]